MTHLDLGPPPPTILPRFKDNTSCSPIAEEGSRKIIPATLDDIVEKLNQIIEDCLEEEIMLGGNGTPSMRPVGGTRASGSTTTDRKASLRGQSKAPRGTLDAASPATTEDRTTGELETAVAQAVFVDSSYSRQWLKRNGYITSEFGALTVSGVAQILEQLAGASSKVPAITREGLVAVASVLRELDEQRVARRVIEEISKAFDSMVDKIIKEAKGKDDTMETLAKRADEGVRGLQRTMERRMEEARKKTDEKLEDIHRKIEEKVETTSREVEKAVEDAHLMVEEGIGEIKQKIFEQNATAQPPSPATPGVTPSASMGSYAAILSATMQPKHKAAIARDEIKTRQIYIEHEEDSFTLRNITEAEILAKANATWRRTLAKHSSPPGVSEQSFKSALKMRNGGIMMEMSGAQAASWLRLPTHKQTFIGELAEGARVRGRAYQTIAEFIPITFDVMSERDRWEAENESEMERGDIESTRWVKAPNKRAKGQRVAHLIVNFSSAIAGNIAINKGMVIKGKRIDVHRLTPEPSRCMKCQAVNSGHIALTCPAEKDTCGPCGGAHRTNECTVELRDDHYCCNCKERGHAAWARVCPHFMKKLQEMRDRSPEASLRFFPIPSDPATWEMVDWTPTPALQNPAQGTTSRRPGPSTAPTPRENQKQRQPPPHQARGRSQTTRTSFHRQDSGSRERRQVDKGKQPFSRSRAASRSASSRRPGQMSLWEAFAAKSKEALASGEAREEGEIGEKASEDEERVEDFISAATSPLPHV